MTIKPEVLDAMVASGCTAEQIAAVVKASLGKGKTGAQRQAEYKARKEAERQMTKNDVTSVSNDETPPSSPDPLDPPSQTLPPIIPQTPSSTDTKRARRLPIEWALPMAWGEWAKGEGFPEQIIRLEAEKFRDFWCSKSGKDATKLDWEATWRNWMRNVRSRSSPQSQQLRQTAFQQRHQSAIDAFDRKLGVSPDDQFTGNTIDLGNADWRHH